MTIAFRYKPVKARQLAAGFLRLTPNHSMNYTKLLRLMYMADRERLLETGSTITGDRFFSLPYGPVLANVLDCIRGQVRDQDWLEHFRKHENDIRMFIDPGDAELCRLDAEIIAALFHNFQNLDWQAMIEYCRKNLPEWRESASCNHPIEYRDILILAGKSGDEIRAIEELAAENLSIDYCLEAEEVACV